ncbi:Gfo/Idh/MocA family oxidoreductase [Candidatus Falkowbacteria bacterium]|nr:Gfo/Idh/MocA family oxidoreductase [Candidatus Falkowbacteria bacterium]
MENKLRITTINDEISDDLNEAIEFFKLHKIKYVELRTIYNKNLINYSLDEIKSIRELLSRNGISVSAFASPLFKWYSENATEESSKKVDTFGFNPHLSLVEKKNYIAKAIEVAKALGTQYIRIFSSLRTPSTKYSFASDHLFEFALSEAQKEGVTLLLENEPPCYIHKMNDIKRLAQKFAHRNLKIWFDVANFYKIREQVFLKDLETLKDSIEYFHLKDFDGNSNCVPLGEGIINYKRIISDIKKVFGDKDIFLSIETHVRSDSKVATKKSLQALNKLLSEKRVRYGIVGCGQVFEKHGSAVSKNEQSELRAVFDVDRDKVRAASEQFDCEAKDDFKELLTDGTIDVINIRTPNDTHADLVLKTLKSGKYCLCEKPLCLTSEEGKRILKNKFYKNNVTVNFQNRFNPVVQQLLEYLGAGTFGKIILCSIDVRWWRDDEYFNDWHGNVNRVGGMLFNQGAHALDLMLKICGPVKNITKFTRSLRKSTKIDDIYLALLQFNSGTLGKIEITTYTKFQSCGTSLFIIGEKGSIKLGGPSFNKLEFLSFKNVEAKKLKIKYFPTDTEDSHFKLIKALNKYLLVGERSKLLTSAEDGVRVTKFIENLYR